MAEGFDSVVGIGHGRALVSKPGISAFLDKGRVEAQQLIPLFWLFNGSFSSGQRQWR